MNELVRMNEFKGKFLYGVIKNKKFPKEMGLKFEQTDGKIIIIWGDIKLMKTVYDDLESGKHVSLTRDNNHWVIFPNQ